MSSTSLDGENIREGWKETYDDIICVRNIVDNLVKTIHTERIYPHLNPIPRAILKTLCTQFNEFLEKNGSLTLQITHEAFIYQDTAVYEDSDMHSSIPFRLHRDGIYEITFLEGLSEEEITKLIDILMLNDTVSRQENDFVTLIWELGSPYITFRAQDEFIQEAADFVSDDAEQSTSVLDLNYVEDNEFLVEAAEQEENSEGVPDLLSSSRKVVELTVEEKRRLLAEVEQISNESFELTMSDILFEIIEAESNSESCQDAAAIIVKIIDAKITLGDICGATKLHRQLVELWQDQKSAGEKAEILNNAIESLSNPQRIERLGRLLRQTQDIIELREYMLGLSKIAVPTLIGLMRQLQSASLRKVICEVLAIIGKDAAYLFTPLLSNPDWRIVRNVAHILGLIGSAKAVPTLSTTYEHTDLSVRREVIKALCLIGDSSSVPILLRAILEPDANIRGMAAVTLGKIGGDTGLTALLREMHLINFRKKEPSEKRLFFQGIGASRSNNAVKPLRKMLLMRSWFNKEQTHEFHAGAAEALSMIGTAEAMAELENGLRSKDESIREACQNAIRSQDTEDR